jgi:hypothetical protein
MMSTGRVLSAAAAVLLSVGGGAAKASTLPVPPVPPQSPPDLAAPIPDKEASPPMVVAENPGVKFTPQMFRNQSQSSDPASGFPPGSRSRDSEDQKGIQTPGFLMTVPLK